ncbi:hypothetical protein DFH06DRAFT_428237 [Mycena polygramma]|nr:hypothetical protein DFH06DRAFT_428237 [Mycena polygramma]
MLDAPPLLLQNTDTFLGMICQSVSATLDAPIMELDIETPMVRRKPPTEPRVLSSDGPRKEVEPELPVGPDIHDMKREKIVIRPRCKVYAQKQKARSIRTLACFMPAVTTPNAEDATPEPEEVTKGVVVRPVKKVSPLKPRPAPPTQPRAMSMSANAKAPPKEPRSLTSSTTPNATAQMMPRALTKSRATVASGRIEKPSRSPPRMVQVADLPMNVLSVASEVQYDFYSEVQYELYSCGCSTPSECQQCTLRRLADKFCAIVSARKDRMIRQNENSTSAMYS